MDFSNAAVTREIKSRKSATEQARARYLKDSYRDYSIIQTRERDYGNVVEHAKITLKLETIKAAAAKEGITL